MRSILMFLAISGLVACDRPAAPEADPEAELVGSAKGVSRGSAGQVMPDTELTDAKGSPASLADIQGEPILLNLWATWCAPCVKELPTLMALDRRQGAPRVIALSQDVAPRGSVDAFLERHELSELEVWHDREMAVSGALGAEILPTTILYDAQGREVWRYVGDLDWTGEEAARLLAEASTPEGR